MVNKQIISQGHTSMSLTSTSPPFQRAGFQDSQKTESVERCRSRMERSKDGWSSLRSWRRSKLHSSNQVKLWNVCVGIASHWITTSAIFTNNHRIFLTCREGGAIGRTLELHRRFQSIHLRDGWSGRMVLILGPAFVRRTREAALRS